MISNDVAAVLVTYGSRGGLCVEALRAASAAGAAEAVVMLNGADEAAVRLIREQATRLDIPVTFLESRENLGSAPGFHAALDFAVRCCRAPYLWLLDDDNVPAPDTLKIQLDTCLRLERKRQKTVAIFGFRPALKEHRAALQRGGRAFPPAGSVLYFDAMARLRSVWPSARVGPVADVVDIPYGPYGGLLVARAALGTVGLPDPRLVLYEDDTEFTERLRMSGVDLVLALAAEIAEIDAKWSASPVEGRPGPGKLLDAPSRSRLYYSTRNRVYFDWRRSRNKFRFLINLAIYLIVTVSALRNREHVRSLRVLALAITDGLRGRLGPRDHSPL